MKRRYAPGIPIKKRAELSQNADAVDSRDDDGPKEGIAESEYYLADFTEEEKAAGIAASVAKFAKEAASERAAVHRPEEMKEKEEKDASPETAV